MHIETFEKLIRMLEANIKERDAYIESIPMDIRDTFFDNTYTNSLADEATDLLALFVNEVLIEEIYWYLYDCDPGDTITIPGSTEDSGAIVYAIHSVEDFISYIKDNYEFDK